ncbi:MAG: FHA domain-containing protein [Christensenellaceae bacterium]|nr:FHA domain-containing protein [Christensenellaceae bacterium]
MSGAVYETVAYIMRYWFIAVIGLMLLTLILVSRREYRERKAVMGEVGQYIGYLEVIGGADDVLGERVGIMKENRLGSSQSCDIVISDPSVRKNHAVIYKKDDQVILVPTEAGSTRINGRRATRPHAIITGDVVQFGDISARVYVKPPVSGEDEEAAYDDQA